MRCAPRTAISFGCLVRGVGDERRLRSAVSRTERAAGLWSGVEPTTRAGRVRLDLVSIQPSLAMAGLVCGWGWGSNAPSCVMRNQHSQDTASDARNCCVKSPHAWRCFLDT